MVSVDATLVTVIDAADKVVSVFDTTPVDVTDNEGLSSLLDVALVDIVVKDGIEVTADEKVCSLLDNLLIVTTNGADVVVLVTTMADVIDVADVTSLFDAALVDINV